MYLIANSGGRVAFTLSETPDTADITITDEAGDPVTVAATATIDGATVTRDIAADEVGAFGSTWRIACEWTAGGQTRTDVEYADIVEDDPPLPWPVNFSTVRARLDIDTRDDAMLADLLSEATVACHDIVPVTLGLVAETRTLWADGASIFPFECVDATAVTDLDGNPLTFIVEPGAEHIGRIILSEPLTGSVFVSGTWGWASTPAQYRRAVLRAVVAWYRRETAGDARDGIGSLDGLPRESRSLLDAMRPVRF